jgi:hypothetical protein
MLNAREEQKKGAIPANGGPQQGAGAVMTGYMIGLAEFGEEFAVGVATIKLAQMANPLLATTMIVAGVKHLFESTGEDLGIGFAELVDENGDHVDAGRRIMKGVLNTLMLVDMGVKGKASAAERLDKWDPLDIGKGVEEGLNKGANEVIGSKSAKEPIPYDQWQSPFEPSLDRGTFREQVRQHILNTPNHPLRFLLDASGNWVNPGTRRHSVLVDSPDVVEMAHVISDKSGIEGPMIVMDAWTNQMFNLHVEGKRAKGENQGMYVRLKEALNIGGVLVHPETAKFWSTNNAANGKPFLDPAVVKNAEVVSLESL